MAQGWQASWKPPPGPHSNPVLVSGLGPQVDREALEEAFGKIGAVADISVPRNPAKDCDFGLAKIRFEEDAKALEAIQKLSGATVGSATIKVEDGRAQSKAFQQMKDEIIAQHPRTS